MIIDIIFYDDWHSMIIDILWSFMIINILL